MSKGKLLLLVFVLIVAGAGAYFIFGNEKAGNPAQATAQASGPETTGKVESVPGELWSKRCEEGANAYCEVFQRLIVKENNQRLIEVAVGYPKDSQTAQAVIVLPLGIVLAEGILIKVDDGAPSKAMIRSCNQVGCYTVMNLPDTMIDSMKNGKKLVVGFLDGTGKQINVELGLEGFGARLQGVTP